MTTLVDPKPYLAELDAVQGSLTKTLRELQRDLEAGNRPQDAARVAEASNYLRAALKSARAAAQGQRGRF